MKSILPKEYIQGSNRQVCNFIGPNTKVILLKPSPTVSKAQQTLQYSKRNEGGKRTSIKEEIGIIAGNKGNGEKNTEKLLKANKTTVLNHSNYDKKDNSRTSGEELIYRNLDLLKTFIVSYIRNPEILHMAKFAFYKDFLQSLGVDIPNNCDMRLSMHTDSSNISIGASNSGEYNCAECDRVFVSNSHLQCHMKTHTEKRLFQCSWCRNAYTSHWSLKTHMQVHFGEKPYKCSQCDKTFKTKTLLIKHMRLIHIGEKPHKCLQCNKFFSTQLKLRTHMARHFGVKQYQCNKCGRSFLYKQHLISHVLTHTREKPYQCSQCGSTFSQRSSFKQHMRIHTREKPYKCNQCDKSFNYKIVFLNHKKIVHSIDKSYKCLYCDEAFSINSKLLIHMTLHTEVKPYLYKKYTQSLANNVSTSEHRTKNTSERPFKCSQCGKTFMTKKSLTKHIRYNHIEKSQFLCTKCSRVFVHKRKLIDHMRIHIGEKPNENNQYGKVFVHSDESNKQMRTHIEELPYTCNIVENDLNFNSPLNKHPETQSEFTDFRNDIIFPESTTYIKQEIDNYNIRESDRFNPQGGIIDNDNIMKMKEEIEFKMESFSDNANLFYHMQPTGYSN